MVLHVQDVSISSNLAGNCVDNVPSYVSATRIELSPSLWVTSTDLP